MKNTPQELAQFVIFWRNVTIEAFKRQGYQECEKIMKKIHAAKAVFPHLQRNDNVLSEADRILAREVHLLRFYRVKGQMPDWFLDLMLKHKIKDSDLQFSK